MANDWLEILKRKQQRVSALRAELAVLEAELRDARAILSGRLNDAVQEAVPRPKSRHGFTGGKRAKPVQEGSSVWWTLQVLKEAGHPLSTDELLRRVNQLSPVKVQKPTLVSNLSRYVKHHDTFSRPAQSTYGLVEWDQRMDAGASDHEAGDVPAAEDP